MEGTEKRIEERGSITYTGACARTDKPWQKPSLAGSYNSITQPAHYARFAIQPLDFIKANKFNFLVGNVIKYVCRYDAKNGLEDLRKAREYLDHLIVEEEARLVRQSWEQIGGQPASDHAKEGTDTGDGSK